MYVQPSRNKGYDNNNKEKRNLLSYKKIVDSFFPFRIFIINMFIEVSLSTFYVGTPPDSFFSCIQMNAASIDDFQSDGLNHY